MVDVSVIAPVYNEEESVDALCEALDASLRKLERSYEVVLVDDGSKDTTWEKLCANADRYPYIRVLRLRRNFGQDVVSGWRKDRKDPFINRRLPSMLANGLISRITGVYLHDYGCTLKAYRREVVEKLHLYGEMHRFIPALASWFGSELMEVPVNHRARQFGTSKYGISRTFRVILDLMTVKFLLRYSTHPIQLFGKIGACFGIPGGLLLGTLFVGNVVYFFHQNRVAEYLVELSKRPMWVVAPFMLILFFMQFISMGLLAEIQIRTYHESQDKPIYVIKETYNGKRG